MTSTRLFLVRHGQTDANVRGALDSVPPGEPLDETGHAQARALAERLGGTPIRAVYASHAVRAQQTAAPVAAALGLDVVLLDGVHEVFVGDLEGRADVAAREAFEAVYARFWLGDLHARMPGGESAAELRDRFLAALDPVLDGADGDVLLVSHSAAIRVAAAALLGDTALTSYLPNAGVVVLRPGAPHWALEHWDSAPRRHWDVTAGGPAR